MKLKNNELSTRELELMFDVTNRTIVNYREGSARITKLPYHTEARPVKPRIYFKWVEVKAWAKKNNVPIVHPLKRIIGLRKQGYALQE